VGNDSETSVIRFTLKIEAVRSSETLVSRHINTWCHNTEDGDMNLYRCENFRSRNSLCMFMREGCSPAQALTMSQLPSMYACIIGVSSLCSLVFED